MLIADRPRVIVAGQVPPPYNGQNTMIARIVAEFARAPEFATEHLRFRFTPEAREMRRGSVRKLVELARVIGRLLVLRGQGPIDLLLFPSGGPQNIPLFRDLLLLPWILLCARRVVVQFHAAGIAARLADGTDLLGRTVAALYRHCDAAVVMTAFNRCDPLAAGIPRIDVIPHRLPDEFDPALVRRTAGQVRLLCVGHLCPEKGTPALLEAFRRIAERFPEAILEFVGECLPPLESETVRRTISEGALAGRVEWCGVLTGRAKQEAFGRADLLVFPTVAPFESFGLVMIEAMMWDLPIVATDWRGNRDVLGPDFQGVCFPVEPDLAARIAEALEQAITTTRAGGWKAGANRQLFLEKYRYDESSRDYPEHAREWLALPG